MKSIRTALIVLLSLSATLAYAQPATPNPPPKIKATFGKVSGNIYVHTSYKLFGELKYPSHGLVVDTEEGLVLIDTPWDEDQAKQLKTWTRKKFKKKITAIIITQAIPSKITGVPFIANKKTKILSNGQAAKIAKKYKMPPFDGSLKAEDQLVFGNSSLEIFYPGEGQTPDNTVIWFPDEKVLFGGGLLVPANAKSLGNIIDANLEEWEVSVKKVAEKYPSAKIIVPSNGAWGGKEIVERTLKLLEKSNNK